MVKVAHNCGFVSKRQSPTRDFATVFHVRKQNLEPENLFSDGSQPKLLWPLTANPPGPGVAGHMACVHAKSPNRVSIRQSSGNAVRPLLANRVFVAPAELNANQLWIVNSRPNGKPVCFEAGLST